MSIKPEDAVLSIAGVVIKSPPQDLLRYCGDQPGDDWVKRVERLNGIIDGLNGRCEAVGGSIVGTVAV